MRDIGDDLTDVRKEVLSRSSSFERKEREGSAAGGDSTGRRFCSQLLNFRMAINKILDPHKDSSFALRTAHLTTI